MEVVANCSSDVQMLKSGPFSVLQGPKVRTKRTKKNFQIQNPEVKDAENIAFQNRCVQCHCAYWEDSKSGYNS